MLEALKFVQGAVSKKDYVPALTHFRIRDQRITGFNGKISLSSPIALDLDCHPRAQTFVSAIEACTETVQLNLTTSGKLRVRSGKFAAHVDILTDDSFPEIVPEGQSVALSADIMPALRRMYEFTAEDAAKPWAAGLLLDGHYMFATNNVILVQHYMDDFFPFRINIPRYTIKEMLRIGEAPISVQVSQNSVSFHYTNSRWLRSQVNSVEWPDTDALFEHVAQFEHLLDPVPPGMFEALETLEPFVDALGKLFIGHGMIATAEQDGASIDFDLPECSFNIKMLSLLKGVATRMAFRAYPKPVLFYGDKLRGVIAGMR